MRAVSIFTSRMLTLLLALVLSTAGLQIITITKAPGASALSWASSTFPMSSYGPALATNSDGTKVFAGAQKGGYISSDSGATWTEISALNNVNSSGYQVSVGMSIDGTKLYYAFNNKVYYSWNSGSTWSNTTTNSSNQQVWSISTSYDGSKILMTTRDGGLYSYSTNSGQSWTVVSDSYGGGWAGAISGDGTKIIIAERNSRNRATGSGIPRMGPLAGPLAPIAAGGAGTGFDAVNTSSYNDWRGATCDYTCTTIVLANAQGGLYTSTDSGATWVLGANSARGVGFKNLVFGAVSSSSDGSRLAATVSWDVGTGLYISTDYGVNWSYESISCTECMGVAVNSLGTNVYSQSNNANPTIIGRAIFQTATTTTLTVANTSSVYGQVDTLTATINSSSATGTVNFRNNGTSITGCSAVTVTSGIATCPVSSLAVGTYSNVITAVYSGGGNYAGSTSTALSSLTVTKASLSVIPTAASVVFGGTPTYLKTYSGFTNGDSVSSTSFTTGLTAPTCVAASYTTSSSVGISPLSITCSGGSSDNYTFTYTETANLTITKATPSVSISLSAATPTYGVVDTITATASLPGTVAFKMSGNVITGCENVTTTESSPYTAKCSWIPGAATASYALTATFSPTNSVDYLTANSSTTTTPNSNRSAITVTPTAGQSKVYGANNPVISYSITSGALIGSDELSGALTFTGTIVGNYTISIGTLANSSYTITLASVTFGITQATQNAVSLSSLSSTYNPSNKTVSLTGSGGSGTGGYTYLLDASNTTPGCSVSGSTLTYTTAGTCVIAVTRTSDTNYLARTDVVSFSIGLASQTITFGSLTAKNYSSDTFTVSASSSSSLTVVFTSESTSVCTTSGSNGDVITLLGVGTCVINANQVGDSNTGAASQVSQNFTVNPRAITITADAKTKVFGAADPSLTYTITSSSLILGDVLTGALTRASGSDSGTYQIQAGSLTDANNPKYAITFVSSDLEITRATPALVLTYPNSNVAILRPGATDTPTVTTSSSSGALTFATSAAGSICTVDSSSGLISLFGAGSCPVVMTTAQTTNYIQYVETTTVTVALLSTSLVGIDPSKLVSMGQPFYAHASIDQSYSFSSGSNGASVAIPAGALDANVPISISLLTDSTSQRAIISSDGTSVLSVVVSWVAPDGSVPSTNSGKAISVTLTNPSIKSGAKIFSIIGNQSQLLGTSTSDGSVTTLITDDPVLLVINPVVVPVVVAPIVDNSAAIQAAKDLADKKAAEEAALKAAQEKMEADAKALAEAQARAEANALAEAKSIADAAALKAAQEAADASAKAAALLQAAKDAELAAAKAADNIKPSVTLYSLSSKLKLSAYDTAYLTKYVKSLKNGASVTCIGYIYSKGSTVKKATALAKSQALAVCAQMKKVNKTLKTSIVTYPASKAPKAAQGAKWVGVSYRIDGFKNS